MLHIQQPFEIIAVFVDMAFFRYYNIDMIREFVVNSDL